MYQHPLERLLIYTDKRDKSEFGIPKQAWYDLYELFTKTKYDNLDDGFTAVDFFNEVFYCLTFTYANEEAAEWLNDYINRESVLCPYVPELADPQSQKEHKAAQELQQKIEYTNWYVLAFVWVILNIQKELPPFVKIFMTALENKLHIDYQDFFLFEDFPEEHPDRYSFDFSLHPEFTEEILFHSTEDWKNATDDFDHLVVTHISQRFWDPDDRRNIIELIQNALAIENAKPDAEPRYSRISHRKKANQEFFDNLLRDIEKDIEYKDNHPQQNSISECGFNGYILHDHRRVMDVLLLITHLGNAQMPVLIKCIKALIRLGYMRNDCFDDIDDFIARASQVFDNVSFERANVKRNIEQGTRYMDNEYNKLIQNISDHLDIVLKS